MTGSTDLRSTPEPREIADHRFLGISRYLLGDVKDSLFQTKETAATDRWRRARTGLVLKAREDVTRRLFYSIVSQFGMPNTYPRTVSTGPKDVVPSKAPHLAFCGVNQLTDIFERVVDNEETTFLNFQCSPLRVRRKHPELFLEPPQFLTGNRVEPDQP